MDKKVERKKLFSLYANNLSLYHSVNDIFLCPICQKIFEKDKIDSGDLSLAHVIPQSINGRVFTLTCTECNNRIGTEYDSEIKRNKNFSDSKKGQRPFYTKLKSKKGQASAEVNCNNGEMLITSAPKHSNPDSYNSFIKEAKLDWSQFSGTFQIKAPCGTKINVSKLHSAFLTMFLRFGYEYVLSPNVEIIRMILMGESINTEVSVNNLVRSMPLDCEQGGLIDSIHILVKPEMFSCFMVLLPTNENNWLSAVLLPGLGEQSKEIYTNIANGKFQGEGDFEARKIECLPRLDDPTSKWSCSRIWNYIQSVS